MFANPAAEIWRRFGAIDTIFWLRVRAQRAFCEAEIRARAAALILRGPRDTRVVFSLSARIAVSKAFNCPAILLRSFLNVLSMSMCSSPGEDCNRRPSECALVARAPRCGSGGVLLECDAIILTSRATGKKVPAQLEGRV